MGLHVKAIVVDRKRVFVGSMNLDPRSEELNSEMGVVIDSEPFAREIADIMEQDMQPKNAWRVTLNEHGDLRWTADGEPLTRQPARSAAGNACRTCSSCCSRVTFTDLRAGRMRHEISAESRNRLPHLTHHRHADPAARRAAAALAGAFPGPRSESRWAA